MKFRISKPMETNLNKFIIWTPYIHLPLQNFLTLQPCKIISQIETLSLIFWMNPNRIIKQCESEGRLNKPGTITGNYKQVKAWHQNLLCIITRVNDIITINLNVNSPTFIFGREVDPISTDQCSSLILSSSWRSDNDVGERCWRQADQYDLVLFKIVLSPMSSYLY